MKEGKNSFKDKMRQHLSNKKEREERKGYGYLHFPEGVKALSFEDSVRKIKLDFLMYKVTDKRHPDRELPNIAVEGTPWWRRPFKVHRDVGPDTETVTCPTSIGKPCPICEYRTRLIKNGADKEEFKVFYPKPRCLYLVVPLAVKKKGSDEWEKLEEEEVFVWDMSTKLFQEVLDETLEEDIDNLDFPLFEGGKTVVCTIKWENLGKTKYPEVSHIEFEKRSDYDESLIDQIPNLDDMISVLPYEEIENKFMSVEDEPDGGSLEEVPTVAKSNPLLSKLKKDVPKKAPAPEPEEEPEQEEEPEEETPPPAPKKLGLKKDAPSLKKSEPAPAAAKKSDTPKASPKSNGKCKFGHKFGVDALQFEECENECEVWNDCVKEKERNEQ